MEQYTKYTVEYGVLPLVGVFGLGFFAGMLVCAAVIGLAQRRRSVHPKGTPVELVDVNAGNTGNPDPLQAGMSKSELEHDFNESNESNEAKEAKEAKEKSDAARLRLVEESLEATDGNYRDALMLVRTLRPYDPGDVAIQATFDGWVTYWERKRDRKERDREGDSRDDYRHRWERKRESEREAEREEPEPSPDDDTPKREPDEPDGSSGVYPSGVYPSGVYPSGVYPTYGELLRRSNESAENARLLRRAHREIGRLEDLAYLLEKTTEEMDARIKLLESLKFLEPVESHTPDEPDTPETEPEPTTQGVPERNTAGGRSTEDALAAGNPEPEPVGEPVGWDGENGEAETEASK